jgi:hypothetical protein
VTACLEILEDRPVIERDTPQLDAGGFEQQEFVGRGCATVDAEQAADAQAKARGRERAVGARPAEAPASRVVLGQISRGCSDDQEVMPGGLPGRG